MEKKKIAIISAVALIVVIVAVVLLVVFLGDKPSKSIHGNISYDTNSDKVLYVTDVRLQEDDGEEKSLTITKGYLGEDFVLDNIGEVSSESVTLYLDIINHSIDQYTITASWTSEEVDGVTFELASDTISSGTIDEITEESQATGTIQLKLNLEGVDEFDMQNITLSISSNNYREYEFDFEPSQTSAVLTSYTGEGGDVVIPESFSVVDNGDGTQSYVKGDQYSVTAIASASYSTSGAFYNRDDITSITLPASITTIGDYAFTECSNLAHIDLSNCTSLTSIGASAFQYCSSLESITLPASLETIGVNAFQNCTTLSQVDFSNCSSLTSINGRAFAYCSSLAELDLSGCTSLETIREYAFQNNTSLTTVAFPASLTMIGRYAFDGSSSLETATFASTEGWFGADSSTSVEGRDIDVTNVSGNAYNLYGSFVANYWLRNAQ